MNVTFARPPMTLGAIIGLNFKLDVAARQKITADANDLLRRELAVAVQEFTPDPDLDRQIAEASAAVAEHGNDLEKLNRELVLRVRQSPKNGEVHEESLKLLRREIDEASARLIDCRRQVQELQDCRENILGTIGGAARQRLDARFEQLLQAFRQPLQSGGTAWLIELLTAQQAMVLVRISATVAAMVRNLEQKTAVA